MMVALGLVIFGLYGLCEARWRRVWVEELMARNQQRHQAQDERDGDDRVQRAAQPADRPSPPTVAALGAQRLCSRRCFISAQPGKDREHRPEPGFATFQVTLDPVENLLLTGWQAHRPPLPRKDHERRFMAV
jgi:hypothetical protein